MVERGRTAHFVVSYDDTLGSNGATLADAVLAQCEQDLNAMSDLFGGIMPAAASLPFHVNLVPGSGGATHPSCLATTITCFVYGGTTTTGLPGLADAEVAEVLMATQAKGFNCAASNGEALSRVIPTVLYPALLPLFSTGNAWMNSSRPDWVTNTDPTDQDAVSVGCGTLFLNYLVHQLGYSWKQVIGAAAPTLAQTAAKLGVTNAFADFSSLLARYFQPGSSVHLPNDNPFPLPPPTPTIEFNVMITEPDPGSGTPGPPSLWIGASGSNYTPDGQVNVAFHSPAIDGPVVGTLSGKADSQGNFQVGHGGRAGPHWHCDEPLAVIANDVTTGLTSDVATGQVDCG